MCHFYPFEGDESLRSVELEHRVSVVIATDWTGSRRLSLQSLLDLRVSRAIAVGRLGRIDLLVDLLNALNSPP